MLTADKPTTDPLTQRYRDALRRLNTATIGAMTVSDLMWVKDHLTHRWHSNASKRDMALLYVDRKANEQAVERLEALCAKCGV